MIQQDIKTVKRDHDTCYNLVSEGNMRRGNTRVISSLIIISPS